MLRLSTSLEGLPNKRVSATDSMALNAGPFIDRRRLADSNPMVGRSARRSRGPSSPVLSVRHGAPGAGTGGLHSWDGL